MPNLLVGGIFATVLYLIVTSYNVSGYDVFDSCQGNRPEGYYCGSNGVNSTWLPCSPLCKPVYNTFPQACLKLCGAFAQQHGALLISQEGTALNENDRKDVNKPITQESYQNKTDKSVSFHVVMIILGIFSVITLLLLVIIAFFTWDKYFKHRHADSRSSDSTHKEMSPISATAPNASLDSYEPNNERKHLMTNGTNGSLPSNTQVRSMHLVTNDYFPDVPDTRPFGASVRRQPVENGPDNNLDEARVSNLA